MNARYLSMRCFWDGGYSVCDKRFSISTRCCHPNSSFLSNGTASQQRRRFPPPPPCRFRNSIISPSCSFVAKCRKFIGLQRSSDGKPTSQSVHFCFFVFTIIRVPPFKSESWVVVNSIWKEGRSAVSGANSYEPRRGRHPGGLFV